MTGRETRLPLMICADGLPPHLQLSLDCLDAGTVFTTTSHRYEVVLANHGLIPAVFQIQRADTAFSRFIDVQPSSGRVEVGGYQALQIALNADRLGNFEELITVHVVGAPDNIVMKFRWTLFSAVIAFFMALILCLALCVTLNSLGASLQHLSMCTGDVFSIVSHGTRLPLPLTVSSLNVCLSFSHSAGAVWQVDQQTVLSAARISRLDSAMAS